MTARARLLSILRTRLRRAPRDQAGVTLVELIAALAILSIVVGSIGTMFVSGQKAEEDLNRRFQAQSNARLALDTFRREVHNACAATVTGGTKVTLFVLANEPNYTCNVVSASWCSQSVGASRYALFRKAGGTCDSTGVRRADYLTTGSIFTVVPGGSTLPAVGISLPVDTDPQDARRRYHLQDSIALRNALRT